MLCARCKKRPAVVYVTTDGPNSKPVGYCLTCAKELGIKPVSDMMEKMGITDEQLDNMQEQFDTLMEMEENGELDDDEDSFLPGGAATLPFIQNMFSSMPIPNELVESNNDGNNDNKSDKNNDDDANELSVSNIDTPISSDNSPLPFLFPQSNKKSVKGKNGKDKKLKRKHLEAYCYNLSHKAEENEIDRIIGREKEIGRIIQILSRRTKNNPCLIGEPGVGKTAIAEGLALKIARGDVPRILKDKEIELLDLTSLVAGTQFRGQFESRIKGLIDEIKAAGNIILFIDEVHNLVGTGDSEGNMNAANILKPALSRGEIQVIGATTFSEYRKYIEKDAALERRFQPVTVAEPSIKSSISVIKGIKDYYESYHRVSVSDEIARKAVILSERYISDRFLPDKAIDLLDEACACCVLRNADLEEFDQLSEQWDSLISQEEELSSSEEIDYERLAQLRVEIAKLNAEIKDLSPRAIGAPVTEQDLSHVVELWTGIPASKVQENELKKLANIEDKLKDKIIGQDDAVKSVTAAIKRNRVQISPRRRPASFIFVGPTGVGKTELVKVLSKELFDSPEALIRLDMSEFMEKHSVSKIIGSPPGYVGYDESGQVTEKVRRRPYSILLFDEIEKAHPDVMNILLQILDEGRITDAHGRVVNFENTIIVMTSNAGSDKKEGALGFAKSEAELSKEKVLKALSEFLRPEFLSRIDEIIVFNPLSENDFVNISELMLNEYVGSLKDKGIEFTFDDKAKKWLAHKAYGKKSGARDLRNLIRKEAEDKIASAIIDAVDFDIKEITLTANSDGIEINIK